VSSSCPSCRKVRTGAENKKMPARARLARSIARVEAATLPWRPSLPPLHPRAWLARVAPTRRSLAVGLGVLVFAVAGYVIARETSMFAIDRIEVRGGSRQVTRQVDAALASLVGRPLVGLDGSAVLEKVDALPTVVSATYDRDFPHTLRIFVVAERPAAVLRRGPHSWLVSTRGRVMERLASSRGSLVFHLRSGVELLLGNARDVKLKVAVAERVLAILPSGSTYLDVSIPGRPVSGYGSPLSFAPQSSSRG